MTVAALDLKHPQTREPHALLDHLARELVLLAVRTADSRFLEVRDIHANSHACSVSQRQELRPAAFLAGLEQPKIAQPAQVLQSGRGMIVCPYRMAYALPRRSKRVPEEYASYQAA